MPVLRNQGAVSVRIKPRNRGHRGTCGVVSTTPCTAPHCPGPWFSPLTNNLVRPALGPSLNLTKPQDPE